MDDIAFYEGPAPSVTPPGDTTLTVARTAADQITISWAPTGGTLQSSDNLTTGWTAAASQANPQTVSATGTRFYRILR